MSEVMNEPNWFEIVLAAVIAVIGWIFKRHVARVDAIEDAFVSRDQLDETIRLIREDRKVMHEQNREDLQYIRERVDKLVDR